MSFSSHAAATTNPPFPARNPSEHDFSHAYVTFILACNPHIPVPPSLAMSTSARLHGLLVSTPRLKSDLPLYPYSLYLIAKQKDSFHNGEDWDWVALVSRLDIVAAAAKNDRPAVETFAEKVRHWALRSRFDAFLSYLLNKPHEYYTVVPPPASSVRGPPQLKMDVERAGLAPSHDPVFQALVPWIPPNNSRSSNSKPRRALPSRDPTVASFDDDYFQFILYCNPDVPVPASFEDPLTAELRCIIHNTPAHDNKTFAPYMLFSAINMRYRRNNPDRSLGSQHWDWEQLAMDLDVLPADADAMTIRRWTQRVKTWAEETRMDAFLHAVCSEGRPHPYSAALPRPDGPPQRPEQKRAGLYPRQDLVYQALHPNYLKRVPENGEVGEDATGREVKRTRRNSGLNSSVASPAVNPHSAIPSESSSPHNTGAAPPPPPPPPQQQQSRVGPPTGPRGGRKTSTMTTRSQISNLSSSQAPAPHSAPVTRTQHYTRQPAKSNSVIEEAPVYQFSEESPRTAASEALPNTSAGAAAGAAGATNRATNASLSRKFTSAAKPPSSSRQEPAPTIYTFQSHQVPKATPTIPPAASAVPAPAPAPAPAAAAAPVPTSAVSAIPPAMSTVTSVPVGSSTPGGRPVYPGSAHGSIASPATRSTQHRQSQSSHATARYGGPVAVPNNSTYSTFPAAEPFAPTPPSARPYNSALPPPPQQQQQQHQPSYRVAQSSPPHGTVELQAVIRAFTNHLQHAKLQSRDKPLSLPEASSLATATIDKIRALCLPSLPETYMAIYIAGVLGLGPALGLGGQVSRSLTVTARENVAQKRLMDWFVPMIPPPGFDAEHARNFQSSSSLSLSSPPSSSRPPTSARRASAQQQQQQQQSQQQIRASHHQASSLTDAQAAAAEVYGNPFAYGYAPGVATPLVGVQFDIQYDINPAPGLCVRSSVPARFGGEGDGGEREGERDGEGAGRKEDGADESPRSAAVPSVASTQPQPQPQPQSRGIGQVRGSGSVKQAPAATDSEEFSEDEDEDDDEEEDEEEEKEDGEVRGSTRRRRRHSQQQQQQRQRQRAGSEAEADWKAKYMRLRKQMRRKESALNGYRRRIMDAVMADLE